MKAEIQMSSSKKHEVATLSDLSEVALDYAKLARSANTQKAYQSDWKDFQFWCDTHQLSPLPADPNTIALYLSDRATNKWTNHNGKPYSPLKASTLQRRLTTIYQAHIISRHPLETRHPIITETWRGILNTIGAMQKQVKPITIDVLRLMLDSINGDSPIYVRDRAILLLGFSGAFRRSELVNLNISHLSCVREGYIVKLAKSKTDQTSLGREVGIPYGSNPMTCPVRAIQDWVLIANIQEGPLFRGVDRHGNIGSTPLSSRAISLIIKRNNHIKHQNDDYSGHSLRAGFATSAAKAGISEYLIMRQTGHKKSDTIKKYIRLGTIWEDNAATKLGL